ncbi:Mitochondrial carrier domain protein [Akanthomyces lecanii RCEF 1005]|uniref:Mitochondrial carrier domain protein n=1 Tax=Akanthomyces lecanii RCEF 1005 TaxID=1081108 RepID=A0A168ISA6_CORDF|nr:Mitochondrial carrier domain protein [Akanthomyces lecanii RCEF 1005]
MDVYVAGAFAAFTVDMLIYPFDTLKTRLQSRDYLKTYAQDGKNNALALRGLYQGIGSVVLVTLPAAGVFFSTYELSKTTIAKLSSVPLPVVHSVASAMAEAASCLVLTPAELIKQHAQMMQSNGNGKKTGSTSLRAFRALYEAGVGRRLFTGYTALLARNLPLTAMQFPIFEHLRSTIWANRPRREPGHQRILETGAIAGASAATAGAIAAFITTPSDVVKTRMMLLTSGSENFTAFEKGDTSRSMGEQRPWRVAKQIYRESGTKGLFRGGGLRSTWTAVGSGLYLGTYDAAKLWLGGGKDTAEKSV